MGIPKRSSLYEASEILVALSNSVVTPYGMGIDKELKEEIRGLQKNLKELLKIYPEHYQQK